MDTIPMIYNMKLKDEEEIEYKIIYKNATHYSTYTYLKKRLEYKFNVKIEKLSLKELINKFNYKIELKKDIEAFTNEFHIIGSSNTIINYKKINENIIYFISENNLLKIKDYISKITVNNFLNNQSQELSLEGYPQFFIEFNYQKIFINEEEINKCLIIITNTTIIIYGCKKNNFVKLSQIGVSEISAVCTYKNNIFLGYKNGLIEKMIYNHKSGIEFKTINYSLLEYFIPILPLFRKIKDGYNRFMKQETKLLRTNLPILIMQCGEFYLVYADRIFIYVFFKNKEISRFENLNFKQLLIINETKTSMILNCFYEEGSREIFYFNESSREYFYNKKSPLPDFNKQLAIENGYNFCSFKTKNKFYYALTPKSQNSKILYFTTLNEYLLNTENINENERCENIEILKFDLIIHKISIFENNNIKYLCVFSNSIYIYEILENYKLFYNINNSDVPMLRKYGNKEICINSLYLLSEEKYSPIGFILNKEGYYTFLSRIFNKILFKKEGKEIHARKLKDLIINKTSFFNKLNEIHLMLIKLKNFIKKERFNFTDISINEICQSINYLITTINYILLINERLPNLLNNEISLWDILINNEFKQFSLNILIKKDPSILIEIEKKCEGFFPLSDIFYQRGLELISSYKNIIQLEESIEFFKKCDKLDFSVINKLEDIKYLKGSIDLLITFKISNIERYKICKGGLIKILNYPFSENIIFNILDKLLKKNQLEDCICCLENNKNKSIIEFQNILEMEIKNSHFENFIKEKYLISINKIEYDLLWKYYIIKGLYKEAIVCLFNIAKTKPLDLIKRIEYLRLCKVYSDGSNELNNEEVFNLAKIQLEISNKLKIPLNDLLTINELFNLYTAPNRLFKESLLLINLCSNIDNQLIKNLWIGFLINDDNLWDSLSFLSKNLDYKFFNLNIFGIVVINEGIKRDDPLFIKKCFEYSGIEYKLRGFLKELLNNSNLKNISNGVDINIDIENKKILIDVLRVNGWIDDLKI